MSRLISAVALLAVLAATPAAHAAPKQTIMPEDAEARAFQTQYGFSDAVIHGDTVYLSGVVTAGPPAGTDPVEHYAKVFARIGAILQRAGSSWDDVLDITTFHVDLDQSIAAFSQAKNRYVKAPFPAWTAIDIDRLFEPSATVEIKIVARLTPKPAGE